MRSVARLSRIASAAARRSPLTSVRSDGLDRHVGAGADREPEVGLGERGRVVHAVAHHGDDPALGLQATHHVGLVRRQHLGDHLVDADLRGHRARGRLVVAGEEQRPQPKRLQRGDRLGRRRLDRVGHREHGARLPSQAATTAVWPSDSAAVRAASSSAGSS